MDTRKLPRVEKDADDPSTPASSSRSLRRQESTTLTRLSRLFATKAATSPQASRNSSYTQALNRRASGQSDAVPSADTATLPGHLYQRGLLEGRHSDITVKAFGQDYHLHRLLLDRAPFFNNALSNSWLGTNQEEITIHPEDVDPWISQSAFEIALKRLYGFSDTTEEDRDPIGLFATGCWLEMHDLVDSAIETMLRQMTPETLAPLIRLATTNYYGRAGDKILASAKAMLCRDGWQMPMRYWDDVPARVVQEIVGGDGFFVDGEWDRWFLAQRILNRRLKNCAATAHLLQPGNRRRIRVPPDLAHLVILRCDAEYRKDCMSSVPEKLQPWAALYVDPEIEPILDLLDTGIHYLHLAFEHLQHIRRAKDCLGLPVVPEKIMSHALWQQMELRQTIVNATENDLKLGLAVECADEPVPDPNQDFNMISITSPEGMGAVGKEGLADIDVSLVSADLHTWSDREGPRRYLVPSCDRNVVIGANTEPVMGTSNASTAGSHTRESDTPGKAVKRTRSTEDVESGTSRDSSQTKQPDTTNSYTHFPPFRFSAEFRNARLLKDRKRVYSRTVFYAGSLWNMYIKKIVSRRTELGVYLHRAREHDTEEILVNTLGRGPGSVDQRIDQLECRTVMSRAFESPLPAPSFPRLASLLDNARSPDPVPDSSDVEDAGNPYDGLISYGSPLHYHRPCSPSLVRSSTLRTLLNHSPRESRQPFPRVSTSTTHTTSEGHNPSTAAEEIFATTAGGSEEPNDDDGDDDDHDSDDDEDYANNENEGERTGDPSTAAPRTTPTAAAAADAATTTKTPASPFKPNNGSRPFVPAMPPYVDARPTIKTYFKIYTPSRGGRMLSVYESAPDTFNFSQSWGWKSSALMVDEGLSGGDEGGGAAGPGDGKLRFMVVLGNV